MTVEPYEDKMTKPDGMSAEEMQKDIAFKTFAVQSLIGQRQRLLALMDLIANTSGLSAEQIQEILRTLPETQSQFKQELFALTAANGKRNGYFVELGACDGRHLSNTNMLEKMFDWRGILVEPSRAWHTALEADRSAIIDLRFVSPESGKTVMFEEAKELGESTVAKGPKTTRTKYPIETVSLMDLLDEHQAPKNIDYLSIDTVGTEFDILDVFNFDKYKFGFISVHNQDDYPVTSLLENNGYRTLFPREPDLISWSQVAGFDSWFVPK